MRAILIFLHNSNMLAQALYGREVFRLFFSLFCAIFFNKCLS